MLRRSCQDYNFDSLNCIICHLSTRPLIEQPRLVGHLAKDSTPPLEVGLRLQLLPVEHLPCLDRGLKVKVGHIEAVLLLDDDVPPLDPLLQRYDAVLRSIDRVQPRRPLITLQ